MKILNHHDVISEILKNKGNNYTPIHVQIEPTELCNFNCKFCHWHNNSLRGNLSNFDFTGRTFFSLTRLLNLVDELSECNVHAIAFTGAGDPCMYKNLWKVLEKIRNNNIEFSITSNFAMPLNQKLVKNLAHASWLRWSMNAASNEVFATVHNPKGNPIIIYQKQKENIERIIKEQVKIGSRKIGVSYVITEDNKSDILRAAIVAKELGCSSISYRPDTPFIKQSSQKYSFEVMEALLKSQELSDVDFKVYPNYERNYALTKTNDENLICYYSNHSTYIAANGDIYPCCYTRYDRRYVMGNIMNENFKSVWHSTNRINFYKKIYCDKCPPCHRNDINIILKYLYGDVQLRDNFI